MGVVSKVVGNGLYVSLPDGASGGVSLSEISDIHYALAQGMDQQLSLQNLQALYKVRLFISSVVISELSFKGVVR